MDEIRMLRRALPEFINDMSLVLPHSALMRVRTRIQEEGKSAKGKKLKAYSKNPLPTFFFTGDNASPALTEDQVKKYPDGISYLDYKKEVGRYTGKTDMTLTGRTWNNIVTREKITGKQDKTVTEDGFRTVISAGSEETQNKLDWNSERYGDLLELSEKEEEELHELFDDELTRFARLYVTSDE